MTSACDSAVTCAASIFVSNTGSSEGISGNICGYSNVPNLTPTQASNQLLKQNNQFVAAVSAVALQPSLLKKVVRIQANNNAGVYGFTFHIRGKPWDVVVDESVYTTGAGAATTKTLVYGRTISDKSMMWGPILEKAWAKVVGSYANYQG